MTPPLPHLNSYPLTAPTAPATIARALELLRPHLPTSIGLYRRLQFGRFHDSSLLISSVDLTPTSTSTPEGSSSAAPWIFSFVDRATRPETECWICGSWENAPQDKSDSTTSTSAEAENALVTSLLHTLSTLPVPPSINAKPPSTTDTVPAEAENTVTGTTGGFDSGYSREYYASQMSNPSMILFGAVHEATVRIMQRLGFVEPTTKNADGTRAGPEACDVFMWDVERMNQEPERALPEGCTWGEVGREHFPLVMSRTAIPRQAGTLAVLPSLGVFDSDGTLVAWAFVGLDGALTSLHVEGQLRGQGLAKTLTRKVLRERMDFLWEEGVKRVSQGYVQEGNVPSYRMCEGLGGRNEWCCYWLRVDLGLVTKV